MKPGLTWYSSPQAGKKKIFNNYSSEASELTKLLSLGSGLDRYLCNLLLSYPKLWQMAFTSSVPIGYEISTSTERCGVSRGPAAFTDERDLSLLWVHVDARWAAWCFHPSPTYPHDTKISLHLCSNSHFWDHFNNCFKMSLVVYRWKG